MKPLVPTLGHLRLRWDCGGHLEALMASSEGYVGACWDYVRQPGTLFADSDGHVGPFGIYFGAISGSLRLCWCFSTAVLGHLEAMLGLAWAVQGSPGSFRRLCFAIWRPCWDYVGQNKTLPAASEGYAGPLGGYVAPLCSAISGSVKVFCGYVGHSEPMLGYLAAMLGLCWAPCGSLGGF